MNLGYSFMRQLFLCISLLLGCGILSAQSFEEQFRAFQQGAKANYESFRDKANERYAEFMRQAWEYYQAAPVLPEPKDDPVPPMPYEDDEQKEDDKEVIIEEVIPTPVPEPQPEPIEPIKPEPQPVPVANKCKFQYFNTQCEVCIPDEINHLL